MLARTRFSAAVLFLVAFAVLAAPPRGHAAGVRQVTGPPRGGLEVGTPWQAKLYRIFEFPRIEFSPAGLAFGSVKIGTSEVQRLTFKNVGSAPALVGNAVITGPGARDYRVHHGGCSGDLAPGASCHLDVAFHPTTTWRDRANLIVLTGSHHNSSIGLEGTGY